MEAENKNKMHSENRKHETNAKKLEQEFSKEQIAISEKYSNQRDLVNTLLEEGKMYTLKTVDGMIDKYLKGKVM